MRVFYLFSPLKFLISTSDQEDHQLRLFQSAENKPGTSLFSSGEIISRSKETCQLANGNACSIVNYKRAVQYDSVAPDHGASLSLLLYSCHVYGSSRRACFSWRSLMAIFSGPGGRKSDKKRRHS